MVQKKIKGEIILSCYIQHGIHTHHTRKGRNNICVCLRHSITKSSSNQRLMLQKKKKKEGILVTRLRRDYSDEKST